MGRCEIVSHPHKGARFMRRRTVGLTVLCTAAAGVLAAVTIPADASTETRARDARPAPTAASGTPGSPVASAEMLAALQRDLGLTPEQTRTRLTREAGAIRAEAGLRAALGPAFAGS